MGERGGGEISDLGFRAWCLGGDESPRISGASGYDLAVF